MAKVVPAERAVARVNASGMIFLIFPDIRFNGKAAAWSESMGHCDVDPQSPTIRPPKGSMEAEIARTYAERYTRLYRTPLVLVRNP